MSAGCDFKGNIIKLLWAWEHKSGVKLPETLWQGVQKHDAMDFSSWSEKTRGNLGIFSPSKPLPGYVDGGIDMTDFIQTIDMIPNIERHKGHVYDMQTFLKDESLDYLKTKRNLSDDAIKRWKLGWHPGARRIAIPQYDRNNKLINIGGRYLESEYDDPFWEPIPWMHGKGFQKEHYLFGENNFQKFDGTGTMVLVEGMFDAIYLEDQGVPNAAAMLGAFLSKHQCMKILKWFNKLVIVPDGDPPGYKAADLIVSSLGSRMAVTVFQTPIGKDPDELDKSEISKLFEMIV